MFAGLVRWLAFVLLATMLTPVAPAQSGQPVPTSLLVEDVRGDVQAGVEGGLGVPTSSPEADLLKLALREYPGEVILELVPAKMPEPLPVSPTLTFLDPYPTFTIEFSADGIAHHMFLSIGMTTGGAPVGEVKFYRGPRSDSGLGGPVPQGLPAPSVRLDARTDSYQITIAKESMQFDELPMYRGTTFSDWLVRGFLINPFGGNVWVGDLMGPSSSPVKLSFGLDPSPVRLSAQTPFHVSNGVATAYTYEVDLLGTDGQSHDITLQSLEHPLGWDIIVPQASLRIPSGGNLTVLIIAVVPFAHAHGDVDQFRLQAVERGVVVGGLQLGLVYTEIPQPSGHHDTLVVHSRAGGTVGYLNTLTEDPYDEGIPIPQSRDPISQPTDCYQWNLALEPQLAMGLDFDLGRTGAMDLTFETDLGIFGDGLNGTILVQPAKGPARIVADFEGTMSFRQEPLTTFSLNATIRPRLDADFVQAGPGSALVLSFTIGGTTYCMGWDASPPRLRPGGRIQLPLHDYHVPVDHAVEAAAGWKIDAPETLQVAPGRIALVTANVSNLRDDERKLTARVVGDLGQGHAPSSFDVPGGATRSVKFAFRAPDLPIGASAELLVAFEGDGVVAGFERIKLNVADPAGNPAIEDAREKRTPPNGIISVGALLLGLAAVRRKREIQ